MNTSFQLFQLQQMDSAIHASQNRILEIEHSLQDQHELAQIASKVAQLENNLKAKQNANDMLNYEIQSKKDKKKQSESMLYAGKIQNPKELQDLQLEINSLTQAINKMEDELLERMIELEESNNFLNEQQQEFARAQIDWELKNSHLLEEKKELERNIKNYLSMRESIIAQLSENNLALYEQLRSSKHGVAVGKLQDNSCSSCGAFLTASQCQQARSPNTLFFCPSCGRIVYGS